MSTLYSSLRRSKRWLLAATLIPATVVAVLVAIPKDMNTYAAADRFVMTLLAVAAALSGVIGFTLAWRRYRDTALRTYHDKAPRAMKDTMQFLLQERHAARRYRLPLLIGVGLASGLLLLSQWPQLALLAPYRPILTTCAIGLLILFLIQPLYARRALINSVFLKRYFRQQAESTGFVPQRKPRVRKENEPAVIRTGPSSFRAGGGFELKFTDPQKNMLVMGGTGSGKTVCVLNSVLEMCLGSENESGRSAGFIFDPKGAWYDGIEQACERAGRREDLYILSVQRWRDAARTPAAIAFNPVDRADEDTLELAAQLITVARLVGGVQTNDSFFLDGARLLIRHSLTLLKAAAEPEPPNLLDLHRLCSEPTDEPLFYESLIQTLYQKYPDNPPAAVETAVRYFSTEYHALPDRQRAGVRSAAIQPLDDFTPEPVSEMITGKSTITIAEILDQGKILYIHLPLEERKRLARILTCLIKLEVQREVLRRPNKNRQSWLIGDEYQSIYVADGKGHGDSDFVERSRESNHANIVASQNLSSYFKTVGNRADVTNFLGLMGVKVFLRNSEGETNEWASRLFGERSEVVVSASEAARLDGGWSRNQTSYSRSTQSRRIVPPDAFTQLAVPVAGDPERLFAESIVHLGSRAETQKLDLVWPVNPLRR